MVNDFVFQIFLLFLILILDLQKLCSTLANVNLCELAEDEERSSSSSSSSSSSITTTTTTTPSIAPSISDHQTSQTTSSQFNSTMISGRSHLNELQKENRAPLSSNNRSTLTNNSISSSSVLSNTIPTYENYQV